MTRVLLVTGSRSLARIPGAEAWARRLIKVALADRDLLMLGDARDGADPWAWDEGATPERPAYVFRTRGGDAGWVWAAGVGRVRRWTESDPPATGDRAGWKPWLLSRNAAMVRAAAALRDAGADVRVLALVDPASRTQGTQHTVRLAREAGLTVDVQTWGQ